MYKVFAWMSFISGFIFSVVNLVFIILNRAPRTKMLRYIIVGFGILALCGEVGEV